MSICVKVNFGLLRAGQAILLELHRVVRREVVDADHLVAAREQALRAMHADEPGDARDEHLHPLLASLRRCRSSISFVYFM